MAHSLAVVILSGPIAVGKTTLAVDLVQRLSAGYVSTSGLISADAGRRLNRSELQQRGSSPALLGAHWIIDAVRQVANDSPAGGLIVVDAARTTKQVRELRTVAAGAWRVLHVHLTGDRTALVKRHDDVLVGGQWGSEGKGNLAFYLAPEYDLLVRVGAPNAGHKVRGYDGAVYTHRQLPSGTRATNSRILIGPGAVIDVGIMLREIADCELLPDRLAVDPSALIIEDGDIGREAGLRTAIGSTGTGGGAALARRIEQRRVGSAVRTARDVLELRPYLRESASALQSALATGGRIFIEGTQGTSLSILHGSFPHVTSRDTTVGTLLAETGIAPQMLRRVVVAVRTYPIRVGGESGPMGREISWEVIAERSGLPADQVKHSELGSVSGNPRRVAEFSWSQLRESANLNGATDIALTFADYIDAQNRFARRFDQLTKSTISFISEIEAVAAAPVSLISASFDGRGPIDRRLW